MSTRERGHWVRAARFFYDPVHVVFGAPGSCAEGLWMVRSADSGTTQGKIMFDSHVRFRRALGASPGRLLFAALVALAACANSFAAPLPPATNGVIAFGSGVINPDGTGLTYWPLWGYDPAWSADGKKIAFGYDLFPGGQTYCNCIYVANADGSGAVPLASTSSSNDPARSPAWSPDGTKIIFESGDGDGLHVVNSDGSNPVALHLYGRRPSWSPDGTRILYVSWVVGATVWTANPDGTNPTFVHEGSEPAWSRDGSRIAFSAVDHNAEVWNSELYTANPDGSNVTKLTFQTADGSSDALPAWSPDGTKLVFYRYTPRGGPQGIYVINADGTGLTWLVPGCCDDAEAPAWQPIPTAPPPFPFAGFFNPLGPAGTLNVAKAGSSVPVKFSLDGNRGLDILAAGSPSTQAIACTGTGSAPTTVTTTGSAGSSGLTYNALSDLYTYVMKTDKGWTNTCRRLTVTLTDGTSHTADFKFN